MLYHHFMHVIPCHNIIIFSPSFSSDKTYTSIRHYFLKYFKNYQYRDKLKESYRSTNSNLPNVHKQIDFALIKTIVNDQYKKKEDNDIYEYNKKNNKLTKE